MNDNLGIGTEVVNIGGGAKPETRCCAVALSQFFDSKLISFMKYINIQPQFETLAYSGMTKCRVTRAIITDTLICQVTL